METIALRTHWTLIWRIQDTLQRLFQEVRKLHDREWHGGYCCVADAKTGLPFAIVGVGDAPPEKWPKYLTLCQEKASRLASHPDHWSSTQSRDDDKGRYPGAIRTDQADMLLSFSGLPATLDEALMLTVAIYQIILKEEKAREIATVWDNTDALERVLKIADDIKLHM